MRKPKIYTKCVEQYIIVRVSRGVCLPERRNERERMAEFMGYGFMDVIRGDVGGHEKITADT